MNREIKFRIWADNKLYNKCLVGNTNNTNDEKWTCPMVWLEKQKEWVHCDNGIICQYTGLHDKNGKEIYEGDIVLTQPLKDKPFSQKAKSKRLRGIVQYQVLCGKNFISEPDKIKYWGAEWNIEIIDKKDYEKYHNYGWGLFFECEVIGNIYDNPELLGGE